MSTRVADPVLSIALPSSSVPRKKFTVPVAVLGFTLAVKLSVLPYITVCVAGAKDVLVVDTLFVRAKFADPTDPAAAVTV